VNLATAPEFREIDANAPEFRSALTMAGIILEGVSTSFSVYSHHSHDAVVISDGQVLFEQMVADGQLKLYPLEMAEAMKRGKPSCWAFTLGDDGKAAVHVLRYADNALFERAGVNPERFRDELQYVAEAFVAEGIHEMLEINISSYLFPVPEGHLTRELTFWGGFHLVDRVPTPEAILRGDWSEAACWSFSEKQPVVTGWCSDGNGGGPTHR